MAREPEPNPAVQNLTHRGIEFTVTALEPSGYRWQIALAKGASYVRGLSLDEQGLAGDDSTSREARMAAVTAINRMLGPMTRR